MYACCSVKCLPLGRGEFIDSEVTEAVTFISLATTALKIRKEHAGIVIKITSRSNYLVRQS